MTEYLTRPPPHLTTRLDVRRLREEGVLIVSVDGEIDVASLPSLRHALEPPLPAVTICDLTGVTFMAASGVGLLERTASEAERERRRFGVVAGTRCVTRLVTIFRLDRRMPVHRRLPDLVKGLRH